MQEYRHIATIVHGWKTVLLFGIASAIAGLLLSFAFPLQYSSTMKLLIIQNQLAQADPYTAIKASERISDNLGQIIYTTSFFEKVLNAKFNIEQSYFKTDEATRRRQWRDMIATQVILGSGLLQVTVYHRDPEQATQVARAIAFVLTTEGYKYVGGGDLQVQLVDEPLQSKFPVRPNIPANGVMGFVLGLMVGTGYVLYLGERKRIFGIPV